MAKYSGDQVAHNPTVVANYLRAAPTTRISTRQIQFLWVFTGEASPSINPASEPDAPNSVFSKLVRGIQAQAEVVIVGSPSSDGFIIGVYADTFNDGNMTDPNEAQDYAYKQLSDSFVRTLSQSADASAGVTGIDVDYEVLYGRGFVPMGSGDPVRAINYVNPQSVQIDGSYNYQGQSSYENELFTD
jgi:hypothetical protein